MGCSVGAQARTSHQERVAPACCRWARHNRSSAATSWVLGCSSSSISPSNPRPVRASLRLSAGAPPLRWNEFPVGTDLDTQGPVDCQACRPELRHRASAAPGQRSTFDQPPRPHHCTVQKTFARLNTRSSLPSSSSPSASNFGEGEQGAPAATDFRRTGQRRRSVAIPAARPWPSSHSGVSVRGRSRRGPLSGWCRMSCGSCSSGWWRRRRCILRDATGLPPLGDLTHRARLAGCRRLHRRYQRKAERFLTFTSICSTLIRYRRPPN